MITIDQEARRNKKLPINIDNFSERYKTENGIYTFTSPSMWTLEQNLYYLLVNSKEVEFEQKYKYKPAYLSYDEYGTVVLSPVLMYVNNVQCIEDFDLGRVVIPSLQAIKDTCKDKFRKKDVEDLNTVDW